MNISRFLLRSEIQDLCLEPEKWPPLIRIDEGPWIQGRPEYWNMKYEEDKYVCFQCVLENGNHEYLHIPFSRACKVMIHTVETIASCKPCLEFVQ